MTRQTNPGLKVFILFAIILFFFVSVSVVSAAQQVTYNFNSTYENVNMFAYRCSDSTDAIPIDNNLHPTCGGSGISGSVTTDSDFDSSDNSRFFSGTTGIDTATLSDEFGYVLFNASLSVYKSQVTTINWTYEGHADGTETTYLYMWNYTSSEWVECLNFTETFDVSYYCSFSPLDFVSVNNTVSFVAKGDGTSYSELTIDYVSLKITYNDLIINMPTSNEEVLNTLTTTLNTSQTAFNDTVWYSINSGTTNTTLCTDSNECQDTITFPYQGYFNLSVWANNSGNEIVNKNINNILVANQTVLNFNDSSEGINATFCRQTSGGTFDPASPPNTVTPSCVFGLVDSTFDAALDFSDDDYVAFAQIGQAEEGFAYFEFNTSSVYSNNYLITKVRYWFDFEDGSLGTGSDLWYLFNYTSNAWSLLNQTNSDGNAIDINVFNTVNSNHSEFIKNTNLYLLYAESDGNVRSPKIDYLELNVTYYLPLDQTPPTLTNPTTTPANNTAYIQNNNYTLNITVTDAYAVDTVILTFDGTNYSTTKIGNVYNVSFSNLPAGTHNYTWWANDTSSNNATTTLAYYTIAKATPLISLDFAPTTATYAFTQSPSIVISAYNCSGQQYTCGLFRNGTAVSLPETITTIAAGTYNYTLNVSETQNYTSQSYSSIYTVSKRPTLASVSLGFTTVTYPTAISIGIGETNRGDGGVTYSLFKDGQAISAGTYLYGAGTYTFDGNTTGGQNYSSNSSFGVKTLTVNKGTGNTTVYVNNSKINLNVPAGTQLPLNATLDNGAGTINLTVNGVSINSGASPLYNLTTFSTPGLYAIKAIYNGNANYTSDTDTMFVSVSTAEVVPPLITINSPTPTTYTTHQTTFNFTFTDDSVMQTCLYSLNGAANVSTDCYNPTTGITSAPGANTWTIWGNDTYGNANSSSVTFTVSYSNQMDIQLEIINETAFGSNISFEAETTTNNTGVDYCNLTLTSPTATIFSNLNGTRSGTIWTYPFYRINQTGLFNYNVTCRNSVGSSTTESGNFTISYNLYTSPTTTSILTSVAETEQNNVTVKLYDDSDYDVNYTIAAAIASPTLFSLVLSNSSILLDADDASGSEYSFTLGINASASAPLGTYAGNITIINTLNNNQTVILFNYTIRVPSGRPVFYSLTDVECSNAGVCNKALSVQQGLSDSSIAFRIKNSGSVNLNECDIVALDSLTGAPFLYSHNNFTIPASGQVDLTITVAPTILTPTSVDYYGRLYVQCLDSNSGSDTVQNDVSNSPYLYIDISTSSGAVGGAGGAPPPIVIQNLTGICGNYMCEGNETILTCPSDCRGELNALTDCFQIPFGENCFLGKTTAFLYIFLLILVFLLLSQFFQLDKTRSSSRTMSINPVTYIKRKFRRR
jgi:hypothetical protein